MKYYIIAGEASGDLHAANLMAEIRKKDPKAEFRAWGGDMMKKQGLKLNASDIYNPNGVSLKDAVGIFGGGCTGEIISPNGLVLTNHHCGYGAIQSHSSVEHDYLTDGFYVDANGNESEKPGWCDSAGTIAGDDEAGALVSGDVPAGFGFWTKGVGSAFTLKFKK